MPWLRDRMRRARWLIVPIAAYLIITIVLPFANAASVGRDFMHHAGWVFAGCIAIIGVAIAGGVLADLARLAVRSLPTRNSRGGRDVGER